MASPKVKAINSYETKEEFANAISHGIGALLSIAALVLLIIKASQADDVSFLLSSLTYGVSLVFLYFSSTLYHSIQIPKIRNKLNVMDHLAIYVLIAGTYTPFTINTLGGVMGWVIFGIVWGCALAGIILKIFFFGKYNTISAIAYVVMGWIIVVAVQTLLNNLGFWGTFWLFAGGVFYTIGAVLFLLEKLPFNHAIFHLFVLAGSITHFISIYYYVLPS